MSVETTDPTPRPATTTLLRQAARHYLGGRHGLIALGALALVFGIALNWTWLVAAGVAPLLLSALPCVAMCALGLCASKMINGSCRMSPTSADAPKPSASNASPEQIAAPEQSTDAKL